jgi:hypothetical protein
MSAFSFTNSSIPSVLFGHNASVKAWCMTGRVFSTTPTQAAFDAVNFIDGYNLRLDLQTQTDGGVGIVADSSGVTETGALKFSFLTPMTNNKYKVFLQFYRDSNDSQRTTFAHVLNSSLFPKTRESFWVRTGWVRTTITGEATSAEINRILGIRMGPSTGIAANLGVVVL